MNFRKFIGEIVVSDLNGVKLYTTVMHDNKKNRLLKRLELRADTCSEIYSDCESPLHVFYRITDYNGEFVYRSSRLLPVYELQLNLFDEVE